MKTLVVRGLTLLAGLGTLAAVLYLVAGGGKVPRESIRAMQFPAGLDVTGDENGVLCHEIRLRKQDGSHVTLKRHMLAPRDWKGASEAQRKTWIIEDTIHDAEEVGLACYSPDGGWFRPAYAQKHCVDCDGGGCISWSCPGTVTEFGCTLGGSSCIITFLCCGAWCDPTCG